MAPSAPNILEQSRLGEDYTSRTHAPSIPTSSLSAPTTPTVPQYKCTTPHRSGMRTISASDFVGMSQPAAPSPNIPYTGDEPFAVSIPSPMFSMTRFNTRGRLLLILQDTQAKDLQAYVEDSDSNNNSILRNLRFSGLPSDVTTGDESRGEPKDEGKEQVGDEGENKLAR